MGYVTPVDGFGMQVLRPRFPSSYWFFRDVAGVFLGSYELVLASSQFRG